MRILVIEDEPRAASRLIRMIKGQLPSAEIVAQLASVKASLDWFTNNPDPDLVFLDVQLEDGDSFEILSGQDISSPIIFCTAYSEYALSAFDANSIDYLLKPVNEEKLKRALAKYERFVGFRMEKGSWQLLSGEPEEAPYKKRLMVPHGRKLVMVELEQVILMEAYLKGTKLIDVYGNEWMLDNPLTALEAELDPSVFFRISRQVLIQLSYLESLERRASAVYACFKEREEKHLVSRSNVRNLKEVLKSRNF